VNAEGLLSVPHGLGMATGPVDHRRHNLAASSTGGYVADSEDGPSLPCSAHSFRVWRMT
jgi:hypothetical protein